MDNLSCPTPEIGHKMTPEFAKICGLAYVCAINCFASYTLDFHSPKYVLGRFKMGKNFRTIEMHRMRAYYGYLG